MTCEYYRYIGKVAKKSVRGINNQRYGKKRYKNRESASDIEGTDRSGAE